jgi:hypothetical protein
MIIDKLIEIRNSNMKNGNQELLLSSCFLIGQIERLQEPTEKNVIKILEAMVNTPEGYWPKEIELARSFIPVKMSGESIGAALDNIRSELRAFEKDGPAVGYAIKYLKDFGEADGDIISKLVRAIRENND